MMRDGLPLSIVMPGVAYGPGDTGRLGARLARYLRGRSPAVPTRTAFCWAHVSDVAWGHLLAMERGRPGQTYILAGEPATLWEVFARAGRLIRRRQDPFPVPSVLLRPAAAALGVLQWPFPTLSAPAEWTRLLAGVTHLGDDTKARRELGFDPRSLEEGLPDTVRSLLEDLMEEVR
jgi:nucleoside-diphosphate-sugar epimerase